MFVIVQIIIFHLYFRPFNPLAPSLLLLIILNNIFIYSSRTFYLTTLSLTLTPTFTFTPPPLPSSSPRDL